ncbi:hypothetical protein H9660_05220 [Clostridium sp. Sa3CUN1]|uniref:Uncharacterized protein n=1 Tax=Clostridium gallinarum TaxID=2762246 RepID=A0ABR8Q290_9CLOT|nr:hypothetical protein [Clostridium gallinarum]MBD7914539.1 hypothetical protein [Clostridium gallinarum]
MIEGQVSVFDILGESSKSNSLENVKNQMKKAINKGIVPGAVVIIDGSNKHKYSVLNLFLGSEEKLYVQLISELGMMSWLALSKRLSVIGFYK